MSSSKKYLNTKEVAQLLQVNEKGVYALVSDKGLPATKVTGKWLFPRHFVEEWLDLSIVNLPAAANPALDSGRLFIAGCATLIRPDSAPASHRMWLLWSRSSQPMR